MNHRLAAVRLACAAMVLLFASSAAADFRQAFKKGIEASDREDWATVVTAMRQAAAEQPTEGEQVRIVGMRYETYLPHFYIGLGLYHGGDCVGALKEWALSTAQAAVQGTPQFAILTRLSEQCRALAPTAAAPTARPTAVPAAALGEDVKRAEAELVRANENAAAVAALRRDPALASLWLGQPALAGRADGAQGRLATARGWLEAGRAQGDRAQINRATNLAGEAGKDLEALRKELEARRTELLQAQARVPATTPPSVAEVQPTRALTPTAWPVPAATATLHAAGPTPRTPAPAEKPPGMPAPPQELRAAATALVAGDYRTAAAVLADVHFTEPRASAVALLLRAACRYALYLEGGERDSALREKASADVRACRRLDAGVFPDRAFFSPRFAEFFQQAR